MDSLTDQAPQTRTGKGRFAPGGPAGNKKALKHGLYTYQAMLNGKGLDKRTYLFKAMRDKELELIIALGGDPSPQQQRRLRQKHALYIASLDNYLMGLKSLVCKGKPRPVLAIRTQLSAHLRENLKTLGLGRVSKTLTVTDVLNSQDEAAASQSAEGMQ